MKTKYAVLSSLFFIIQLVGVLPLRAEHYYFKQISLKEGLPSNVRCILRDEQGFVWIGTKSGLGKFDGHELKRYKHQANDPNSLLHNLIYQIAEDKQHNIWVLTEKVLPVTNSRATTSRSPRTRTGRISPPIPSALSRTESSLAARTGFTNIVITILLSGFCNISTPTLLKSTLSVCGIQRRCFVAAVGQAYTS